MQICHKHKCSNGSDLSAELTFRLSCQIHFVLVIFLTLQHSYPVCPFPSLSLHIQVLSHCLKSSKQKPKHKHGYKCMNICHARINTHTVNLSAGWVRGPTLITLVSLLLSHSLSYGQFIVKVARPVLPDLDSFQTAHPNIFPSAKVLSHIAASHEITHDRRRPQRTVQLSLISIMKVRYVSVP